MSVGENSSCTSEFPFQGSSVERPSLIPSMDRSIVAIRAAGITVSNGILHFPDQIHPNTPENRCFCSTLHSEGIVLCCEVHIYSCACIIGTIQGSNDVPVSIIPHTVVSLVLLKHRIVSHFAICCSGECC